MIHRKAKALPPNGCDALRRMAGFDDGRAGAAQYPRDARRRSCQPRADHDHRRVRRSTANLPGIDVDARNAFAIAVQAMAVPRYMQVLSDRQLSVAGMRTAIA